MHLNMICMLSLMLAYELRGGLVMLAQTRLAESSPCTLEVKPVSRHPHAASACRLVGRSKEFVHRLQDLAVSPTLRTLSVAALCCLPERLSGLVGMSPTHGIQIRVKRRDQSTILQATLSVPDQNRAREKELWVVQCKS